MSGNRGVIKMFYYKHKYGIKYEISKIYGDFKYGLTSFIDRFSFWLWWLGSTFQNTRVTLWDILNDAEIPFGYEWSDRLDCEHRTFWTYVDDDLDDVEDDDIPF